MFSGFIFDILISNKKQKPIEEGISNPSGHNQAPAKPIDTNPEQTKSSNLFNISNQENLKKQK